MNNSVSDSSLPLVKRAVVIGVGLIGGSLAAGGANALNQYLERDIDARMQRTSQRPLPQGTIAPRNAAIFGLLLGVVAAAWLTLMVNAI